MSDKKHIVYVAPEQETSLAVQEKGWDVVLEHIKNHPKQRKYFIIIKEFNTAEEATAFIAGVEIAAGNDDPQCCYSINKS